MDATRAPRLFAGGLVQETNVLSPIPCGRGAWVVVPPSEDATVRARATFGSTLDAYRNVAATQGVEVVIGTYATATPAGITPRRVYEELRDHLLAELRAVGPVAGVLLTLHGAMVADGYVDCELDIVQRVREVAGGAVIGVLFDLHCDIPDALLRLVDVLITFKEYPHTDVDERASELVNLVMRAIGGGIQPVIAAADCRMFGTYPTTIEPMASFVRKMEASEAEPGVLSVSLGHGFTYGDSPAMDARTVVVTDADRRLAEATARRLADDFFLLREEVALRPLPLEDAITRALTKGRVGYPIVVGDCADNAGGGAASDSTFALSEFIRRKARNVSIAMIWDPVAVQLATAAGEGARIALRLGGKTSPASGDPVDVHAKVKRIVPNLIQRWPQAAGVAEIPCGDAVHLVVDGIDVIVNTRREQVLGLDVFTALGIDPTQRRVLIVKSMNHFRAAFAPIASEIIYMTSPGALPNDPRQVPYRSVDRHKWPWLDDPWADGARN